MGGCYRALAKHERRARAVTTWQNCVCPDNHNSGNSRQVALDADNYNDYARRSSCTKENFAHSAQILPGRLPPRPGLTLRLTALVHSPVSEADRAPHLPCNSQPVHDL